MHFHYVEVGELDVISGRFWRVESIRHRYAGGGRFAMEMSLADTAPTGLTREEALRRRDEFGANLVADKEPSRGRAYLAKFWAPIPWMLEVAIIVQIGLGSYIDAVDSVLLPRALLCRA